MMNLRSFVACGIHPRSSLVLPRVLLSLASLVYVSDTTNLQRGDKTRRGFSTFLSGTVAGSSSSSSSAGRFSPQVVLARASSSGVGSVRGGRGGVLSSVPGAFELPEGKSAGRWCGGCWMTLAGSRCDLRPTLTPTLQSLCAFCRADCASWTSDVDHSESVSMELSATDVRPCLTHSSHAASSSFVRPTIHKGRALE
jgi:hypothetical protein